MLVNQKSKNSFYCMNVILSKRLSKNRMKIIKYLNERKLNKYLLPSTSSKNELL